MPDQLRFRTTKGYNAALVRERQRLDKKIEATLRGTIADAEIQQPLLTDQYEDPFHVGRALNSMKTNRNVEQLSQKQRVDPSPDLLLGENPVIDLTPMHVQAQQSRDEDARVKQLRLTELYKQAQTLVNEKEASISRIPTPASTASLLSASAIQEGLKRVIVKKKEEEGGIVDNTTRIKSQLRGFLLPQKNTKRVDQAKAMANTAMDDALSALRSVKKVEAKDTDKDTDVDDAMESLRAAQGVIAEADAEGGVPFLAGVVSRSPDGKSVIATRNAKTTVKSRSLTKILKSRAVVDRVFEIIKYSKSNPTSSIYIALNIDKKNTDDRIAAGAFVEIYKHLKPPGPEKKQVKLLMNELGIPVTENVTKKKKAVTFKKGLIQKGFQKGSGHCSDSNADVNDYFTTLCGSIQNGNRSDEIFSEVRRIANEMTKRKLLKKKDMTQLNKSLKKLEKQM